MNAWDQISMGLACIFTIFVSRHWFYLYSTVTILATLSYFLAMALMPESPKWLMFIGRESEAIDSLNYIAWLNGSEFRFPKDESVTFLDSLIAAKH